ncbi:MAG: ANTAR domain-containing protein [Clostridia bacterium]|nr:ANTAR domain-containing protein [Clostridia bacterium]
MSKVLIVTKSRKATELIMELMQDEGYTQCQVTDLSSEARRYVEEEFFDLIFIYTPLSDEIGLNLSVYMVQHTKSGVFIAISEDTARKTQDKLSSNGVIVLRKPVSVEAVHHSILALRAMRFRMGLMEEENKKLITQLEDMKIINRAKMVLMQCLGMSEQQAHRYLEKQAMDLRVSRRYIAEQVLNTYET